MRIVFLVALKDLRQRLRDRTALLVSVVAPLGLAFIFSQLLAGATDFRAVYVVADMDGGPLATVLARGRHRLAGGRRHLHGHGPAHRGRGAGRRGGWHGRRGVPGPGRVQRGHRRGSGRHAGGGGRPGLRARDGDRAIGRTALRRWGRDGAAVRGHGAGACPRGWSGRLGRAWRDAGPGAPGADRRGRVLREAPGRPRRPDGRAAPAEHGELLLGVDGDPVPVLLGADGPGQPVRRAAPGHARADPGRAREARGPCWAASSWAASRRACSR